MGDSAVSSSARQSCQKKKNQKKEQKKNKLGRRRNQTQQKNKHQVPSFISQNEPASSPYDVVVSSPSGRVLKGYQRVMTQHTVTHGKKGFSVDFGRENTLEFTCLGSGTLPINSQTISSLGLIKEYPGYGLENVFQKK